MWRLSGVVLILVGVALCVWTVISPGISWDAGGLHIVPRFYLGLGWVLGGILALVIGARRKDRGPDKR
jgi:hypothetical protein